MKVSLFYLPTYFPEVHGSASQLYRDILEETEFADQAGFHGVWFAEHHFFHYGGMCPSPAVLGAAVAARTRRLRIGSGITLVTLNDPIRVAEEYAMLDALSGGRLNFGIGRGFQRAEYDAFSVPMNESRARFNEAHELIVRAWQQHRLSFEGRYRSVHDLQVLPRPTQRPLPPIYVACIFTRESFEWAASLGYHLMYVPYVSTQEECVERLGWYRDALVRAGHEPASGEVLLVYHFFMGESAGHGRDYARPFISNYLRLASESNQRDADPGQYQHYGGLGTKLAKLEKDFDYMYPRRVIFGDAAQCLERFAELAEMGVTEVGLLNNFGGMPHLEIMRSLERFAGQVLARL